MEAFLSSVEQINLKLYRHYKNKPYKYIGEALHSETLEPLVIYETLYPNDLGSLWARPKEMFFEDIHLDGKRLPRFKNISAKLQLTTQLSLEIKTQIIQLLNQVFEEYNQDQLDKKLTDKIETLFIGAFEAKKLIGFKLGYQLTSEVFYSWLGAVSPDYRKLGLGKELMKQQHDWCLNKGYKTIKTKTMNQWKPMLCLNIQNGFEITGTEVTTKNRIKILMEKTL